MIAAIDTSVLTFLFYESAAAPIDASTGLVVTAPKARLEYLLLCLEQEKAKLIIPTPALAEILVKAGASGPEWLAILKKSSVFKIATFDILAAVEHAATQQSRRDASIVKPMSARPKAKFDDQIVAIAAVQQATVIYSDDPDIRKIVAGRFDVYGIADLRLPPQSDQYGMALES